MIVETIVDCQNLNELKSIFNSLLTITANYRILSSDLTCCHLWGLWHIIILSNLICEKNLNFASSMYRKHRSSSFSHTINTQYLFLKFPNSCQMAAHDLKIYISIFFSWIYIRKYLKSLKEFSHWLRIYVLWFKSMSFYNLWIKNTYFFGFKKVNPNLFQFGYLVENWYEKLYFDGEIAVQISQICPDSWKLTEFLKVSYTWY